ncbi:cytochrome b5 domain-containing protein [Dechloromonas sp. A34]|uniref:cytochrome b5 domain-containing protein n=1 Tax=Dechloromonas sp. A34 TaxID=447588 RepID=UPI0022493D3E|nr:cytochrome b5-like heme/steroid binding domain-containing protein [Dechloromonas sp. A34]
MRRLYLSTTLLFWLLVTAFWAASLWLPPAGENLALAAEKTYSKADLTKHASAENCWMAIRGGVYDLSAYLPDHPSRPEVVLPWCGREATEAYNTKTKGRPHAPYADELLAKYKIGKLAAEKP